jgi:hypothetical protein
MIWWFKYIISYHMLLTASAAIIITITYIIYNNIFYSFIFYIFIPQLLLLLLSALYILYILHNMILYVIQIILSSSTWSSSSTSTSSTWSCHNLSVNFSCHIITSLVVPWTLCLHITYYTLHTLSVLYIYIIWYDIYIYHILPTASAASPTYIIKLWL